MSEQIELLNQQDVIKIQSENMRLNMPHNTFQVSEFTSSLQQKISRGDQISEFLSSLQQKISGEDAGVQWLGEGVEAKVLSVGKKWRKGKVRLTIEFISDEPDEPKSPLDDFRKQN
jgi:hypothetical protein